MPNQHRVGIDIKQHAPVTDPQPVLGRVVCQSFDIAGQMRRHRLIFFRILDDTSGDNRLRSCSATSPN